MNGNWRWLVSFWLAFFIALYVWIRLARYEYRPPTSDLPAYVFDRWTTRVDTPRVTPVRFVADPAPRTIP